MDNIKEQDLVINDQALEKILSRCRSQLVHEGMTDITECFSRQTRGVVVSETLRLFHQQSERRDFLDQNGSPRNLFNVTEKTISIESPFLKNLYYSERILHLLQLISCEKINFVPFPGERYIINGLVKQNDNQGWHWDDYAYAMVFVVKSPKKEFGGMLEYVPHVYWDRKNPRITQILKSEINNRKRIPKGHVYLMRSDNTLHRVSSIKSNKERIAFITAYRNDADLLKNLDHYSTFQLAGLDPT